MNLTEEYVRNVIEAGLTAAWLRRTGPSGQPGVWTPAEFLMVVDDDVELELRPFAWKGNVGASWYVGDSDAKHAWNWYFPLRGLSDEPSPETRVLLDGLIDCDPENAVIEERGASFGYRDQDPDTKPEVPDAVVKAFVLIAEHEE